MRLYLCPECYFYSSDPTELGPHIERHREVDEPRFTKTGRPLSVECPKGCGRHFKRIGSTTLPVAYREHRNLCDGSLPLKVLRKGSLDWLVQVKAAEMAVQMGENGEIRLSG